MTVAVVEKAFLPLERREISPSIFCVVVAPTDIEAARALTDDTTIQIAAYSAAEARNRDALHPPSLLLGLLALSSQGRAELEKVRDHWIQRGHVIPEVTHAPHPAKDPSAQHWLQARLCEHVQRLAQRNVALQKELGVLRAIHEETQNAFANLEELVAHRGMVPADMAFVNECTPNTTTQTALDEEFFVDQVLPISTHGLIGVELHFIARDSRACGALNVTISAIEDSKVLATFDVLYESIRTGWHLMELDRGVAGPPRGVQVRIAWNSIAGKPPALSLGALQIIDELCATSSDCPNLGRALAMRVWRGLPGVRPPSVSPRVARASNGAPRTIFGLPPSSAVATEEISPPAPGAEIQHVQVLEDGNVIQVHPRFGTASVARVPCACPINVRHVSATIRTNHPKAGKVEYAMAVVPKDTKNAAAIFDRGPDASIRWSGWICIEPGRDSQVHVFLDERTTVEHDLLLATRTPPDVATDFAWAQWSTFVFRSHLPRDNAVAAT